MTIKFSNCVIFVVLFAWTIFIWHVHQELQRLEDELPPISASLQRQLSFDVPASTESGSINQQPCDLGVAYKDEQGKALKFLIFQGDITGQGTGNHMNGLLAAHLLGEEFDRIVCVSPAFRDFWLAFEPLHPLAVRWCPQVISAWEAQMDAQTQPQKHPRRRNYNYRHPPFECTLTFINFLGQPDECELQRKLASNTSVWYLRANMYPRWPTTKEGHTVIPPGYFEKHYKPNQELTKLLPPTPPSIVVHLRKEDGPKDHRNGLDPKSLQTLGDLLSNYNRHDSNHSRQPPYLVTNNVEWYDYFEQNYQWDHPKWDAVIHSALLGGGPPPSKDKASSPSSSLSPQALRDRQKLWMWSDWYTCYKAQTVFHTHSDFSASAVHWKDPGSQSSRVIRGYNATTQTLELVPEWWRPVHQADVRDDLVPADVPSSSSSSSSHGMAIVPPLVARTPEQLLHCSSRNATHEGTVKSIERDSTKTHLSISLASKRPS